MKEARNWLSVEADNQLIRVHILVKGRNYYEEREIRYPKPVMPLWVLGQLSIGRWMEVDPQMRACIIWIEKQLARINGVYGTNFSLQSRRLAAHGPCQFGLVGG